MHTCVEGSKRQLPPWMMQKAGASSNVSNSGNVVETKCSTESENIIAANVRKKDQNKETSRRKSNLNVKCEVKGRKNLGQQNGSGDDITQKKKEKGNRCRDRALRSCVKKRKNLADLSHGSSDEVYPVEASSEDEMELTVEDLVAIAEQYVKDYEKKEQKKTIRQCESKWQLPATTEAETALDSPCENKKTSSSEREALYNSSPTTGEVIPRSITQTGNPAQDMLDLLLGPLLRKTIEKEEKSKSSVESVKITHEFMRQSQNELVGEEIAPPLLKKRSTLKDKVAMFLD